MEKYSEELREALNKIDLQDASVSPCPARVIKRKPNYLHGSYGSTQPEFLCKLTEELCEFNGYLFEEEIITKGWFCLGREHNPSLPQIEMELIEKASKTVPTVEEQIKNKRYIDYAKYAILRGKIKR